MNTTTKDDEQKQDEGVSFKLTTSRYGAGELVAESGLVPVRISLGIPRFPLQFVLSEACGFLFPQGWMLKLDYETYRRKYRHHLHKTGVRRIRERLEEISRKNGGRGLVLLCYEDLTKPGEWCHRTIFSEWWEQKTGQKIEELGGIEPVAPPKVEPKDVETQLCLFA